MDSGGWGFWNHRWDKRVDESSKIQCVHTQYHFVFCHLLRVAVVKRFVLRRDGGAIEVLYIIIIIIILYYIIITIIIIISSSSSSSSSMYIRMWSYYLPYLILNTDWKTVVETKIVIAVF